MRIIAGIAKGRRLAVPPGDAVRPTSDRVKEAWFSSLAPRLPGARVLDLFSGSGALGLEAASRGATAVVCVERDRRSAEVLQDNINSSGLTVRLVVGDAAGVLVSTLAAERFDVVVMDPPYRIEPDELTAVLVALEPRVAVDGEVWIEMARRAPEPTWPASLQLERTRRYGDTVLHTAVRRQDPT